MSDPINSDQSALVDTLVDDAYSGAISPDEALCALTALKSYAENIGDTQAFELFSNALLQLEANTVEDDGDGDEDEPEPIDVKVSN